MQLPLTLQVRSAAMHHLPALPRPRLLPDNTSHHCPAALRCVVWLAPRHCSLAQNRPPAFFLPDPAGCRDWLRGTCQYGAKCKHPHPPFDLPARPPPPDHVRVVYLKPGAPIWHPATTATAAAVAHPSARSAVPAAPRPPAGRPRSLLESVPQAAVQALASSYGVAPLELEQLLPPDALRDALEQVQLQLVEQQEAAASVHAQMRTPPPKSQPAVASPVEAPPRRSNSAASVVSERSAEPPEAEASTGIRYSRAPAKGLPPHPLPPPPKPRPPVAGPAHWDPFSALPGLPGSSGGGWPGPATGIAATAADGEAEDLDELLQVGLTVHMLCCSAASAAVVLPAC